MPTYSYELKINLFFLANLLFYFCNSILIYFTILNNFSTIYIYMVDNELFLFPWVSQNLKPVLHTTNVITVRNLKRFDRVLEGSGFFPLSTLLATEKRTQHCRSILLDTYSVRYTSTWCTRLYDMFKRYFLWFWRAFSRVLCNSLSYKFSRLSLSLFFLIGFPRFWITTVLFNLRYTVAPTRGISFGGAQLCVPTLQYRTNGLCVYIKHARFKVKESSGRAGRNRGSKYFLPALPLYPWTVFEP